MTKNGRLRRVKGESEVPVYPIRTVSRLTGVSEGALRAWEARYGIITPARTAGGHRLFSGDDIDRIQEIRRLLHEEGMSMAGIQRMFENVRKAGNA